MPKTVIVYGPAGCGKSTNAEAIARHFGIPEANIVDDWQAQRRPIKPGFLHLSNDPSPIIADTFQRTVVKRLEAGSGKVTEVDFAHLASVLSLGLPIKWGAGTPGPYTINGDCDWDVDTGGGNTRYYIGQEGHEPIAIVICVTRFGDRDPELDGNMRMFCEGPAMVQALRDIIPANASLKNPNIRDRHMVPVDVPMGSLRRIAAILARIDGEKANG